VSASAVMRPPPASETDSNLLFAFLGRVVNEQVNDDVAQAGLQEDRHGVDPKSDSLSSLISAESFSTLMIDEYPQLLWKRFVRRLCCDSWKG
jgi:hypothetical protein